MALSQEDLRKLQEGAEEELKGYEDLPDGDYYGIIKDAARGEKWEHDMVTLEIDITEGEYTGRKKWANYTLDHQNQIRLSDIGLRRIWGDERGGRHSARPPSGLSLYSNQDAGTRSPCSPGVPHRSPGGSCRTLQ